MQDNLLLSYLHQLLPQTPTLLAYAVGFVFVLVFWNRAPRASVFALVALLMLFFCALLQSFVFVYFIRARDEFGWDGATLSMVFTINSLVANALRAAAVGFLIAAVYIGRPRPVS